MLRTGRKETTQSKLCYIVLNFIVFIFGNLPSGVQASEHLRFYFCAKVARIQCAEDLVLLRP